MEHNHVSYKEKGIKKTKQRNEIIEIIAHSDYPLSAEEIYLELNNRDVKANLSTVYRTIETLVSKAVLSKVSLENEAKNRYELVAKDQHFHHLICLKCHKIISIEHCPLENYEQQISLKHKFKIISHTLDLYGYCNKCASVM